MGLGCRRGSEKPSQPCQVVGMPRANEEGGQSEGASVGEERVWWEEEDRQWETEKRREWEGQRLWGEGWVVVMVMVEEEEEEEEADEERGRGARARAGCADEFQCRAKY